MLARGRSRPYIREKLCISTSTVASHTAHIYQKLGVHSKQEIIDAIEAAVEAVGNRANNPAVPGEKPCGL